MIVFNLLFLIASNVFIPVSRIPPVAFAVLPLLEPTLLQKESLFSLLHLPRRYEEPQLKASLRDAMKEYHPDKGGSAQSFQRVRNAKKVLSYSQGKPYDTLGIEAFASDSEKDIQLQIDNNTKVYYIQVGMFYVISLIFLMAVTYQIEQRYLRKYAVLVLLGSVAAQLYSFTNPHSPTLIDFVFPKMPLHRQCILTRNICSVIIAILLSIHSLKQTPQKLILKSLPSSPLPVPHLKQLQSIYQSRLHQREIYEKSFVSKMRKYLLKGISIFCVVMMALSLIR